MLFLINLIEQFFPVLAWCVTSDQDLIKAGPNIIYNWKALAISYALMLITIRDKQKRVLEDSIVS